MFNDLKRNGSGYYDPTAYKALKNIVNEESEETTMRKGEVWEVETTKGYEIALVISVQEGFCNILILNDEKKHENEIDILVNVQMYTNPTMMYWRMNKAFKRFIKSVSEQEFDTVMRTIIQRMGICEYCSEVGSDSVDVIELEELKRENEKLKKLVELNDKIPVQEITELKTRLAVSEAQRDVFEGQCKEMFQMLMQK